DRLVHPDQLQVEGETGKHGEFRISSNGGIVERGPGCRKNARRFTPACRRGATPRRLSGVSIKAGDLAPIDSSGKLELIPKIQ
ncbi:MAG: hypothetical protein V4793_41460, partial [Paraburkholderia tropica]